MQARAMVPGIEWCRRSRLLAVAAFVTLGLVLVLGSTPVHAAQLTVIWSDGTPDDHTGFKVERKTGTTGAFAQVTTTGPTVMSFLDTALTAGTNYCYRVRAYNTVGDSPYTAEACGLAPTPVVRTLTVAKSGTGTGSVDSSPTGITCGTTCSATYTSGTSVALSATPATGATFTGWSGACTGTGSCTLVLDADKSATATFALSTPTTYALSVTKAGTGSGTVTSSPSGINCGSTCSASYNTGTSVTLTATPATGSTFTGWGGACSGTGSCAVTVSAATSVTATFAVSTPTTYTLSVTKSGAGTGTVTSSPTGISCGSTCSASYNTGTSVTLTATPATGSTFTGWGGACSGTGTCAVTVSAATSVTATFAVSTPITYTLSVTKAGTGTGTVTSSPTGISCGSTCSASYNTGTSVTLTATPATGSTFTGWGGACSGTGTCAVSMTAAQSVTATFTTSATLALNSLTANKTAPQAPGTAVTFTANLTGGTAPYQTKWWQWNGTTWSVLRDWAAGTTHTWTPTQGNPSYVISAWARSAGNTADAYEAGGGIAFPVSTLALTGVSANKTAPQAPGTAVTFTANLTGGTAPYQTKWWLWNGTAWSVLRDWAAGTTHTWTPTQASSAYQVFTWARSAGNTADAYEAGGGIAFPVSTLALTSLSANKTAPQAPGTAVTFTANLTGGTAPYQTKWWLWNGTAWSVLRDWAAGTTHTWTPTQGNPSYVISAWARSAGNTADAYEAGGGVLFPVMASTTTPLAVTSLTADKPGSQPVGTTVTFTAAATGGTAPYQYKWWGYNGTSWILARDWSTSNSFSAALPTAGSFQIRVWVRSNGTTTDTAEASAVLPITVTP